MALKTFRPTTASLRGLVSVDRSDLWKGRPVKELTEGKSNSGGRNNQGRVTIWHRGGGHKRRFRRIDFRRNKHGVPARVAAVEYDPNRSANIALVLYADGERRYIIAPKGVNVGTEIQSGAEASIKPGNCLPLRSIPVGSTVHCVELKRGGGAQLGRAAGAGSAMWLLTK